MGREVTGEKDPVLNHRAQAAAFNAPLLVRIVLQGSIIKQPKVTSCDYPLFIAVKEHSGRLLRRKREKRSTAWKPFPPSHVGTA